MDGPATESSKLNGSIKRRTFASGCIRSTQRDGCTHALWHCGPTVVADYKPGNVLLAHRPERTGPPPTWPRRSAAGVCGPARAHRCTGRRRSAIRPLRAPPRCRPPGTRHGHRIRPPATRAPPTAHETAVSCSYRRTGPVAGARPLLQPPAQLGWSVARRHCQPMR